MTESQGQSQIFVYNYGHSTQLIGVNGRYVLTDPHFGRRCVLWPRKSALPDPAQLPELDAVCISHAHPDHLNISSFKYIPSTVPVIVPSDLAGALRHSIQNPIVELHWWARFTLPSGLSVTAVPALHSGGIWIPWRYRTVCGFLVSHHTTTVYFAGDTRMGTHFKEIGNTVKVDVALLPIGGIFADPLYGRVHLTPGQAVEAAMDLQPQIVIPIHWGTFGWSKSPNARDVETFKGAALMHHLETRCTIVPPGEAWQKEIL
jgi:L-ascorbate metabolism protein UlaG (beta-lactamase superfamily)